MASSHNQYRESGWYVVIDSDECVIYASRFSTQSERNRVENDVAQRLTPGRWYGFGWTVGDATAAALERCRAKTES